jgi:hypothetical protein
LLFGNEEHCLGTKYLARTVIEGGRASWNKWFRRDSNGRARVQTRRELARLLHDPAAAEGWPEPRREPVRPDFRDKLGPARRWLQRRVGERWDDVFHELLRTFDPRTIAGRHIVFDHMLDWVRVDAGGILLPVIEARWPRKSDWIRDAGALARWLAGRRVLEAGTHRYWLLPTTRWSKVNGVPARVPTGRYRQDRALTKAEERAYLAFSPAARRAHWNERGRS